MGDKDGARIVYSSAAGRVCPTCGWPSGECRCSSKKADAPVPPRVVARLRIEKAGRGGKTVSVVYGLPENAGFVKELCQELKRACGTGGAVVDGTVQLQGDLRERIRAFLLDKGIGVKG